MSESKTFSKYEYAAYKVRTEEIRAALVALINSLPLGVVVTVRKPGRNDRLQSVPPQGAA